MSDYVNTLTSIWPQDGLGQVVIATLGTVIGGVIVNKGEAWLRAIAPLRRLPYVHAFLLPVTVSFAGVPLTTNWLVDSVFSLCFGAIFVLAAILPDIVVKVIAGFGPLVLMIPLALLGLRLGIDNMAFGILLIYPILCLIVVLVVMLRLFFILRQLEADWQKPLFP